jgi:nitrite reductase/ring-hydroxylating ferredoxin subunit/uncharacterized membrane protein
LFGWAADLLARHRAAGDALNGLWLGHPLHPAVSDLPVGAMTSAALLDAAGHDRAARLAILTGLTGMVISAPAGVADAADATGRPRRYATVHGTLMTGSALAYAASLVLRLRSQPATRMARLLSWMGYAALTAGGYVGGDLTYRLGNQVDRHAWRSARTGWQPVDAKEIPDGTLVRVMVGGEPLAALREGDTIRAIHATCTHRGAPLDRGTVENSCVRCPWHGSMFRLADGRVVRGPAIYSQPAYEIRPAVGGGYEARAVAVSG